jgi:hypothetical protein
MEIFRSDSRQESEKISQLEIVKFATKMFLLTEYITHTYKNT